MRKRSDGRLAAVVRRRWWLLGAWSLAQWWLVVDHTGDWGYFRAAAGLMFGGQVGSRHLTGGIHTYVSAPELQFGPPAVLLAQLARAAGSSASAVFACVGMALVLPTLWALERTAIHSGRAAEPTRRAVLLLGVPVVYSWGQLTFGSSHLDDVLVIVCCTLAAPRTGGRRWLTPVLVGTAIAAKPWGLVGLPLAMPARGARRWPAIVIALLVAVAWWSPFLLDPRTLHAGVLQLKPMAGTTLHLLVGPATLGSYWRSAQLLTALSAAALAARRSGYPSALLAGVSVRLLLDPSIYPYYWTGLIVAAALHDLIVTTRAPRWSASVIATACILLPLPLASTVASWVHGLLILGCLTLSLGKGHSGQRSPLAQVQPADATTLPRATESLEGPIPSPAGEPAIRRRPATPAAR